MLVLQNTPLPSVDLRGLSLRPLAVESGTAKFDLTLSLEESAEGLAGSLEYAADLFDGSTVDRLRGYVERVFSEMVERPERRLSDLRLLSVEAGLGFDSAISRICQKSQNPLTAEFEKYLTEMRLGKARRDSLRQIQTRTGVDDLTTFIGAVIQADQLGTSMAKILRVQSEQLRTKRRQRAEQLAQQAPLKMLFPMIMFIFPSVFVVILGPSIPQIMSGFS